MSVPKQKKALIVGAGISGLGAAQKLFDSGFEVQILEARNDHGGRIRKNVTFTNFSMEIGAEEIHRAGSAYHRLAVETGAILKRDDELNHYFEDVEKEELIDREEFLEKYEDSYYYKDIVNGIDSQDDSMSILTYCKNKGLDESFISLYEGFWGAENGGSLSEISVKGYGEYERTRVNDHELSLLPMNMSHFDILEKAFEKVLPFISYNSPVTDIHYISKEKADVENKSAITVFDDKGKRYETDFLIITVPISQLQNNSIHFHPELPPKKQEAINRMKLGRGGKIHLKFKKRFWPENTRNMYLKSRISFIWNLFQKQEGKDGYDTTILAGLIAGEVLDDMQDPEKRKEIIDELLEKMIRVFKYPAVKEELVEILWSDFTNIEYIGGNYSLPVLHMSGSKEIYQEPVDDVLYFAGEASHVTESMTIHGAYDTGLRDAQRILDICAKK